MESLYITRSGLLRRKQNTIVLETQDGVMRYPIKDIEDIHVLSKVKLNTSLLEFLTKERIPIHFYNYFGHYIGSFYPKEYLVSGHLLVKQAMHYGEHDKRLYVAKQIVKGAMNVMAYVLKSRNKNLGYDIPLLEKVEEYKKMVDNTYSIDELMGVEGTFRSVYLTYFDGFIKHEAFRIRKRTRRPPMSYGNALMSYLNSMVYSTVLTQIYHTHLDPRIGYLHETGWRRFALSLDIAEIFKPLIADRLMLTLINRGEIKEGHFSTSSGATLLTKDGKRKVIRKFDDFVKSTIYYPKIGRKLSWKRLIRVEVYRLEKHLLGDEIYTPYVFPFH